MYIATPSHLQETVLAVFWQDKEHTGTQGTRSEIDCKVSQDSSSDLLLWIQLFNALIFFLSHFEVCLIRREE